MEIGVGWLKDLVPGLEGTPRELADRLSLRAIPVDRVVPVGEGLGGILVARVLEAGPHPDADRLTLCRVDAGGAEPVDVVCGAPNVETRAFYPYIPPGATLPGGMRIESRRIRGRMSHGMLCSEKELGLGRDAAGILRLDGEFRPGEPFAARLGLPDARLELDLTPNRIDLACHVGVAREFVRDGSGALSLPTFEAEVPAPRWAEDRRSAGGDGLTISIDDPERCSRYLGALIRGVRVGPSPAWLQARLRSVGARPINNVVDATNYVLLELNQPLHAFDLAKIGGGSVRVRAARDGEVLRTLDGVERRLGPQATVIADADSPIALAGVMGGEESEVGAETTDVLLECAAFDPRHTRHTARGTGLATDASYRFERGIDERGLEVALDRCIRLIVATAGGESDPTRIRVGRPAPRRRVVGVRPGRVRQVLGLRLSADQVTSLLAPLGFEPAPREAGDAEGGEASRPLPLLVPGWRGDVSTEADLLEEIARTYGYEAFPDESRRFRPGTVPTSRDAGRAARTRTMLAALGLFEARSVAFASEERTGPGRVALLRPLSAAEGFLRTDLVPGLLDRLAHNWSRGRRDVRLFEIGTVFGRRAEGASDGEPPVAEERRIAFLLTGAARPAHWSGPVPDVDLWDCRGVAEEICERLLDGAVLRPAEEEPTPRESDDALSFGTASWLSAAAFRLEAAGSNGDSGALIGVAGLVRADALDIPPWAGPVFAGELRLAAVAARRPAAPFRPLPQFPPVTRDLAVVVSAEVPSDGVRAAIRDAAPGELRSLSLFDVFEGESLAEGTRSLAWRLEFRAPDRTLTDDEVDAGVERIVRRLKEEFDARIRAS
ncbi:MAG: phenylalanine--tRNA ligase subunit beta [Gemmatimonadota bacterium]|nr:phenylalanine--tRNA ligase subunit beta [Gemmatimonadota bacterium]